MWTNDCLGHYDAETKKRLSPRTIHSFTMEFTELLEMIKDQVISLYITIPLASQQGQKQMHHVSIIEIYIFQKNTSVSLTIYLLDFISRQHVLSDYKLMYHAIFPFIQLCMTFYSIEKSPGSQTHSFSSTKLQFQCKQFFLFHLQHAL